MGGLAAVGVISDVHLLLQPHALLRAGAVRVPGVARQDVPLRAVRLPGPGRRDGSVGTARGTDGLLVLVEIVVVAWTRRRRHEDGPPSREQQRENESNPGKAPSHPADRERARVLEHDRPGPGGSASIKPGPA